MVGLGWVGLVLLLLFASSKHNCGGIAGVPVYHMHIIVLFPNSLCVSLIFAFALLVDFMPIYLPGLHMNMDACTAKIENYD